MKKQQSSESLQRNIIFSAVKDASAAGWLGSRKD